MGFRSGNMLKTIPITSSVPSMKPNGPVHPDVARCDGLEIAPYKLLWDFRIPECLLGGSEVTIAERKGL